MSDKFHPLADIFPLLDDDALDALTEDMRAHGFRRRMPPIVMFEDKVLDGRNRTIAPCKSRDWPSNPPGRAWT
jgi:hypothetical protein